MGKRVIEPAIGRMNAIPVAEALRVLSAAQDGAQDGAGDERFCWQIFQAPLSRTRRIDWLTGIDWP